MSHNISSIPANSYIIFKKASCELSEFYAKKPNETRMNNSSFGIRVVDGLILCPSLIQAVPS